MLSNQSVRKEGYVQKELRYALEIADEKPEGTIFIIPIKLDECVVPSSLHKYQWLNYFAKDAYEKLLRSLRKRAEHLKESGQELILPKAGELQFEDIQFTTPPIEQKRLGVISRENQERIVYETLRDLEDFLFTSNLSILTFNSLAVLKDDILKIIKWLRDIEKSYYEHGLVKSYGGALESLKDARDNLQIAQSMFRQEYLEERKSPRFFKILINTRSNIEEAMSYFRNE